MTEYKKLLKGAKTIDGMFKVHIVKDKYYFEIPKDLMGRDFMIASRVSSTSNIKYSCRTNATQSGTGNFLGR